MHRYLVIFSLTILFLTGCRKDRPPLGEYEATFTYVNPDGLVKTHTIEITESTRDILEINGQELVKNGKKIKGTIVVPDGGPYHVQGEWSKKFLSDKYRIEGTFIEIYYVEGVGIQNSGDFVITSEFE